MRLVVLGTGWAEAAPMLRVREAGANTSTLEPLSGFSLNYRIDDEITRHCVGHVPFRRGRGSYHDCSNRPEPGSRRCERCTIVEATFASNLHHAHTRGSAELDPAIVEHLAQPNELYLAAFRDGSLKIGTTTAARRDRRLTEQGAWRALIVADADDGYIVRDIEDAVTDALSLPQAITVRRKITGLISPVSDDQLVAALEAERRQVLELVDEMNSSRLRPTDPHQDWVNPAAVELAATKLYDYPLRLHKGAHDLTLVGAVGRVAIAQRTGGDDKFAVDLQDLFGVELELGEFESDEIAIQDSLF